MQVPVPLKNLINQATLVSNSVPNRTFRVDTTIITPEHQIPGVLTKAYANLGSYDANHADHILIMVELQPGVYYNSILPYKDNLKMEVREIQGIEQTTRTYKCVPLDVENPTTEGGSTSATRMERFDQTELIAFSFQLIDLGYAKLKNKEVGNIYLQSKVDEVITSVMLESSLIVNLPEPNDFKGIDFEKPISNTRRFKQVIIPPGTKLKDLVSVLQKDPRYGIYNKGVGSYYLKGMWYVYPLYGLGRYEQAKKVLDIFRIPSDAIPTLETTHMVSERTITVLGMGVGKQIDNRDIKRQNEGVGKRVVLSDAYSGESGYYYENGKAVTTKSDSVVEYKFNTRADGEDSMTLDLNPTNNFCLPMSENAFNEGVMQFLEWHNSDRSLLVPGMPVKYYYMEGDVIAIKEGTLIGCKTEYKAERSGGSFIFREHSVLQLFLIDRKET